MMLNWVYGTGAMSDEMTGRVYNATSTTIDDIEAIIAEHHEGVVNLGGDAAQIRRQVAFN